ncbi:MAG: hypothetical protein CVT77_12730 [Alphaproteobacteria bacterium HGW-Alphaproteobacteria-16]|nr:MAG: hypothetical protein CVT77_12730 [Alphaproteobacteria bacterium HGW-Alphaproteobacteria-16]
MQRVRVGLTGLVTVMLLIGVASAVFTSANKEVPVVADGASNPDVVANMTDTRSGNAAATVEKEEPIVELGIAPRTAETPAPVPTITPFPIPEP